jgi:hypothetical protein
LQEGPWQEGPRDQLGWLAAWQAAWLRLVQRRDLQLVAWPLEKLLQVVRAELAVQPGVQPVPQAQVEVLQRAQSLVLDEV